RDRNRPGSVARTGAEPGPAVVRNSVRTDPPAALLPRQEVDGHASEPTGHDGHRHSGGNSDRVPERLPALPTGKRQIEDLSLPTMWGGQVGTLPSPPCGEVRWGRFPPHHVGRSGGDASSCYHPSKDPEPSDTRRLRSRPRRSAAPGCPAATRGTASLPAVRKAPSRRSAVKAA